MSGRDTITMYNPKLIIVAGRSAAGKSTHANAKKKAPVFSTRASGVVHYVATAMYSADAVPSGIGSLSSIKP